MINIIFALDLLISRTSASVSAIESCLNGGAIHPAITSPGNLFFI